MSNTREPWKITLIGAGNLAWHLGHALTNKGIGVSQVISRRIGAAQQLAQQLHAASSDNLSLLEKNTDICILCVSDDAIPQVLNSLDPGNCLVIHTAGSVPMAVLSGSALHYGVLYPLQTFTREKQVAFEKIPLLIEGNSPEVLKRITRLAGSITDQVIPADSNQRLSLHLAAVFASNFSNHMYALAEKISREHGLSFELLRPLMEETTSKAISMSPVSAQTGPAVRRNRTVIEKHLALLQEHPDLQQLYKLISESIERVAMDNVSCEGGPGQS